MEDNPKKTFVITTEPMPGVPTARDALVGWPLMGVVLAVCFALDWEHGTFLSRFAVGLLPGFVLAAMWIAMLMLVFRLIPRGTWTISEEGVQFAPVNGSVRCICWKEVERVHCSSDGITFAGGGTRIRFSWSHAEEDEREELQRFVHRALQDDFDLPALSPPTRPVEHRRAILRPLYWPLILGLLGILGTIPIAAVLFYVALKFPATSALEICTHVSAGTFLAALLFGFWILNRRSYRQSWCDRKVSSD